LSGAPEFSVLVPIDSIHAGKKGNVAADDVQRAALAKRFGFATLHSLSADYELNRTERKIALTATLHARLEQYCAISGEPFPVEVNEGVNIAFLAAEDMAAADETELESDNCDVMEYHDRKIDVGEAIAQSLFLALDPYPRGPDADAFAKKAGLKSEEEAGAFGALAALKDRMG
jgi:uncharacterized metal-binding protein YceD (DUF177 family)